MKRITIDTGKCSGHGRCYTLAPAFFEPDDEGFPIIVHDVVADGASVLAAAVDNCPERAISLTDEA